MATPYGPGGGTGTAGVLEISDGVNSVTGNADILSTTTGLLTAVTTSGTNGTMSIEGTGKVSAVNTAASTYTITSALAGGFLRCTGTCEVTLPGDTGYGTAYSSGADDIITIGQGGAGTVTLVSDGTALINGSTSETLVITTTGEYQKLQCVRVAASTWEVTSTGTTAPPTGEISIDSGPIDVAYATEVTTQNITVTVPTGGAIVICANTQGPLVSGITATGWSWARVISEDDSGNTSDMWIGTGGTGGAIACTVTYASSTTACLTGFGLASTGGTPTVQAGSPQSATGLTSPNQTPGNSGCCIIVFQASGGAIFGVPSSPWVAEDSLTYFANAYIANATSGTPESATFSASAGTQQNVSAVFVP
jgi:hypothetical protein